MLLHRVVKDGAVLNAEHTPMEMDAAKIVMMGSFIVLGE